MRRSNGRFRARVVARWSEERVLLETADGSSLSLDVEAEPRIDVGAELWIARDPDGTVTSWSLADDAAR